MSALQSARSSPSFALTSRQRDRRKRPLFVYQMGKVASTSLVCTLRRRLPGAEILDAHFITSQYIDEMRSWLCHEQWDEAWRRDVLAFLDNSQQLGARFTRCDLPVTVVTVTRDPLAQALSAFFQHTEAYGAAVWGAAASSDQRLERLLDFFDRETRRWAQGARDGELGGILARFLFDIPHRWFDDELRTTLGVNAYATEFPHGRGYQIISTPRVDALILRFEDLATATATAFDQFLGLENVRLDTENVSGTKACGALMRAVLASLQLSPRVAEHAYSTRYARHFYSYLERQRFARRWTGKEVLFLE